jgi:hypothetical protein
MRNTIRASALLLTLALTLAPLSAAGKVTVRYTSLPDGQNLAHQISVSR